MDGTLFELSVERIEQEITSYLDRVRLNRIGGEDPAQVAATKTQLDLVSAVVAELLDQAKKHKDDLAAREILQALWPLRCLCAGEPNSVAEQPNAALFVLASCMVARHSAVPESVRNSARLAIGTGPRISVFDHAVILEWISSTFDAVEKEGLGDATLGWVTAGRMANSLDSHGQALAKAQVFLQGKALAASALAHVKQPPSTYMKSGEIIIGTPLGGTGPSLAYDPKSGSGGFRTDDSGGITTKRTP